MTRTPPADRGSIRVAKIARFLLLAFVVLLATAVAAQAIPDGTIIPAQLDSSLDSGKTKPGREFTARVMQDLPGTRIRAGNKIVGHVLGAQPAADRRSAQLALQFDSVETNRRRIPISTHLRALASMMEVADAQVPASGPDRGTPASAWTTVQVGGEVVYRGGGPVASGSAEVGEPTANGVLAWISEGPGSKCRGELANDHRLQAFWVFSSTACGAYGYPGIEILHSGRSAPVGQILLASRRGNVHLQGGSGILLRVSGIQPKTVPKR
jgi:hypothetical protein